MPSMGALLESKLLVLKTLQVCRRSAEISLKPPAKNYQELSSMNCRHSSGCEDGPELGLRDWRRNLGGSHGKEGS